VLHCISSRVARCAARQKIRCFYWTQRYLLYGQLPGTGPVWPISAYQPEPHLGIIQSSAYYDVPSVPSTTLLHVMRYLLPAPYPVHVFLLYPIILMPFLSYSVMGRLRLKCDGPRVETKFLLSAKRASPFKTVGASVQSTTGSRDVRISGSNGSNAGYTMFRSSVKSAGYPLHSPVFPSLPLPVSPCAITFQLESTNCGTVALYTESVVFLTGLVTLRTTVMMTWHDMTWHDMIFIYCSWVSTRWQRSVDWYKSRRETSTYKRRNSTQNTQKHRIHKTENKNTTKNKHKRNTEQHKSSI
jgi:hypothetical protein